MDIYGKFVRSWRLFRASVSVIMREPKLLVFPLLTALATLAIAVFFLTSFVVVGAGVTAAHGVGWREFLESFQTRGGPHGFEVQLNVVSAVIGAALYLFSMFLATFSNVAFYHEILSALRGDAVSISRGVRFAVSRLRAILLWTLFAGLVGLIIKAIEERLSFVGRLIARFLGMAWSLASVFVIPALVCAEPTANPIELLKFSAMTLRRTWGEALIGYVGLSFGGGIVALGSVAVLGGGMALSFATENPWYIAVVGAFWLVGIFAFAYLSSVAGQVYKAALYLYAAEGVVADPYQHDMFQSAFRTKRA
jgi:Family of unknown function (DUF6159)